MEKLKNPLISVIVPIYNVEKYIRQCIESIICQTYSNLEIILVDDGSPDKCGDICDEYAKLDNRIKVIHQENKGLSAARNAGIKASTGEYIGFIDSDDFIMPNMYEVLLNICIDNECNIAKCSTIDVKNRKYPIVKSKSDVNVYSSKEILDKIYSKENIFNPAPCNKLYSKRIFKKILFEEGIIHEDEAAMVQFIYYAERIAVTNDILYCYYLSPDSIMRKKFSHKRFDVLKAFEIRMEFLKKVGMNDLFMKTQVQYSYIIANLYYQLYINGLDKNEEYMSIISEKYKLIQEDLKLNRFYNDKNRRMEQQLYKYPYIIKKYNDLKNNIKRLIG